MDDRMPEYHDEPSPKTDALPAADAQSDAPADEDERDWVDHDRKADLLGWS